jgi:hypothetical protein
MTGQAHRPANVRRKERVHSVGTAADSVAKENLSAVNAVADRKAARHFAKAAAALVERRVLVVAGSAGKEISAAVKAEAKAPDKAKIGTLRGHSLRAEIVHRGKGILSAAAISRSVARNPSAEASRSAAESHLEARVAAVKVARKAEGLAAVAMTLAEVIGRRAGVSAAAPVAVDTRAANRSAANPAANHTEAAENLSAAGAANPSVHLVKAAKVGHRAAHPAVASAKSRSENLARDPDVPAGSPVVLRAARNAAPAAPVVQVARAEDVRGPAHHAAREAPANARASNQAADISAPNGSS